MSEDQESDEEKALAGIGSKCPVAEKVVFQVQLCPTEG
jgi:hypothetical protein